MLKCYSCPCMDCPAGISFCIYSGCVGMKINGIRRFHEVPGCYHGSCSHSGKKEGNGPAGTEPTAPAGL